MATALHVPLLSRSLFFSVHLSLSLVGQATWLFLWGRGRGRKQSLLVTLALVALACYLWAQSHRHTDVMMLLYIMNTWMWRKQGTKQCSGLFYSFWPLFIPFFHRDVVGFKCVVWRIQLGTDINSTSVPRWFNVISLKWCGNNVDSTSVCAQWDLSL